MTCDTSNYLSGAVRQADLDSEHSEIEQPADVGVVPANRIKKFDNDKKLIMIISRNVK